MSKIRLLSAAVALCVFAFSYLTPAVARVKTVSFKSQIKPILSNKCIGCHNKDNAKGGLDLSSKAGIAKGGRGGKLFVAGKGAESLFVKRLHGKGGDLMPKGGDPLTASQIKLITKWIDEGGKM